jgi:hypothetical protein
VLSRFVFNPSHKKDPEAMYKRRLPYGLAAAVLLAGAASADDPKPLPPAPASGQASRGEEERPREYVFNIGLYRLKHGPADGSAGINFHPQRQSPTAGYAARVPHAFGSLSCEQCHTVSLLTPAEDGWTGTLGDRVVGEALTASVAEVIAEPVLSTTEGTPAQLRLQGGEVEYFVREGESQFRLERVKDQSGVEVKLSVAGAECENDTLNVTVPFEIRITTLDERQAIEGVELPVGKPVFRTFEWDAALTCHPGQMNAFTLDSPRQGRILVVVRLDVQETGTAARPVHAVAPL